MTTHIEREAREAAENCYPSHMDTPETFAIRAVKREVYVVGYVAGATRRESPVTEPTPVRIYSRSSGKAQAMIDALLAQANKLGISVEIIRPEPPVTDAEITSAVDAFMASVQSTEDGWWYIHRAIAAALEAARATREEHR